MTQAIEGARANPSHLEIFSLKNEQEIQEFARGQDRIKVVAVVGWKMLREKLIHYANLSKR